ncbi:TadE family type IV pilus minor pilin [Streptomyces erythrochromogenes]|uniref:TadE family type IV pilus minor pilin n=1 Tax=Streptomyces erythrochromogenes TaxID=285574 RepID=UPI00342543BE
MCRSEEKRGEGRGKQDRGYVTAEAALVIPALVLFAASLVWALMAAAGQIRCVDAARAGARAASRSEPAEVAVAAARDAAPPGARVELERVGDLWRVRVAAPAPGPAGIPLRLGAQAVALAEDSVGPPP